MNIKGPEFVKWFNPLLSSLKQSGGSGSVSEVITAVAKNERGPESIQKKIISKFLSSIQAST